MSASTNNPSENSSILRGAHRIAAFLQIAPNTLYAWVREDASLRSIIRRQNRGGRGGAWMAVKADLENWVRSQESVE